MPDFKRLIVERKTNPKEVKMKIKYLSLLLVLMVVSLSACMPSVQTEGASAGYSPETAKAALILEETAEPPSPPQDLKVNEQEQNLDQVNQENVPLALVEDFYEWYTSQPGEEMLIRRGYESHALLSDIFKSDVGYLLDSFVDQSGYDPFTCSQAILPGIEFAPVFVSGGEALLLAQVVDSGETRHYFVVHLGQGEGSWKIDAIHCPFEPATAAIAFYTGYLGHISGGMDMEMGVASPNSPFQDGFWGDFFLVSDQYRAEITQAAAEHDPEMGGSDPILDAQALPLRFWVQPGQTGADIEVSLTFGPYSTRRGVVHLVQSPLFYWIVDGIEMQDVPAFDPEAHPATDTSTWQAIEIEEYGFAFRVPGDWQPSAADLSQIPPEDPVKETHFFFPSWGQENLPALWASVLVGTEEQVMNYYVVESHQQIKINGQRVWVDRDQCETRFVFQHPAREDTWLVIGNNCPSLPGRQAYQQALELTLAPLLRSVAYQ